MKFFISTFFLIITTNVSIFGQGNQYNYELSSAIYRELNFLGGHWHGALFLFFEYENDLGIIRYSEQGGGGSSGSSDLNSFLSVQSSPYTIGTNVSNLFNLKTNFRTKFSGSLTYRGAYSNMATPSTRSGIAATGWQLGSAGNALGIGYTWTDMLDYNWFDWDGTIEDIDDIRCDGVMEYSYEKNNSPVSNGVNISIPDIDYVELHNNFHEISNIYMNLELCPRIQAGEDHGGSGTTHSTFDPLISAPPSADNFSVNQFNGYVQLNFKISDNASVKSYVMLQVKRSNESVWQIITDSYSYVWKFKKTDLTNYDGNTQYDYFHIPWHGHSSGSTFYGSGNYDLKITVIDQGANYSEQIFSFNATTYGGSLPALAPPEPYLQSYGNYVGLGTAGSYYSSTITIQNLGLQTLYSAVNYNYRNYDCYSNNPDAPLLPSNYLFVYGCPYNMYTVNSQSSALVSCWQYRPNLYIPPGEYYRTFYQYAEISGKRLENNVTDLVSVWGYVGNPYPGDECGNDEPEGSVAINPEVELFNKNLRTTSDGVMHNNLKKQVFDNYKRIIERYPDSSIAVHALNGIIQLTGIKSDSVAEFLSYIDELNNRFSNKKINFYSQYIRSHFEIDGEKKLQILDRVFTKNKSTVLGLLALTDKFYHFFRTRQDSLARNTAEEIKKYFSDSPIVYEVFDVLAGSVNGKKEISESLHNLKDQSKISIPQSNDATAFLTNHPNPFNPSTTISFAVPEISEAELGIYNSVGQKVKTLYTGNQRRGTLSVVWDGKNDNGNSVASGIYFAILQYQQTSLVRKIILLK